MKLAELVPGTNRINEPYQLYQHINAPYQRTVSTVSTCINYMSSGASIEPRVRPSRVRMPGACVGGGSGTHALPSDGQMAKNARVCCLLKRRRGRRQRNANVACTKDTNARGRGPRQRVHDWQLRRPVFECLNCSRRRNVDGRRHCTLLLLFLHEIQTAADEQ